MLSASLLAALFGRGQASTPVRTVDRVELSRYVGDWFEVARYPNIFERRCTGEVRASYAIRADGGVDVVNRCRTADGGAIEAHGVGRVVDPRTSAKLKILFAPAALGWIRFLWGDYWIIGLADDYSWAVVGSPNRRYLWILSRTRELDSDRYALALAAAMRNGFDITKLIRTSP